jgi:ubiquinol-cytochrome c reductase cytochrome b subunit
MHIGRGLYYFSFYYWKLWVTGVVIFVLSMAAGFFGYVLPWGQMSY